MAHFIEGSSFYCSIFILGGAQLVADIEDQVLLLFETLGQDGQLTLVDEI